VFVCLFVCVLVCLLACVCVCVFVCLFPAGARAAVDKLAQCLQVRGGSSGGAGARTGRGGVLESTLERGVLGVRGRSSIRSGPVPARGRDPEGYSAYC
jgi:hypothetical protein